MLTILAVLVGSELGAMGSPDWRVRDAVRPSVLGALAGSQSPDAEVRWRSVASLAGRTSVVEPRVLAARHLTAWGWCGHDTAALWASSDVLRRYLADSAADFGLYSRAVEIAPWESEGEWWWAKQDRVLQVQGFINAARLRANGVQGF